MRTLQFFALAIGVSAMCAASTAGAQAKFDFGQREYLSKCASCHGAEGKGDGVLRGYLTKSPTDLTTLTKRNGGVFPYQDVAEVIDGRKSVGTHGSRDMPVWGSAYVAQSGKEFQDWPYPLDSESYARARIAALADYLNRVQAK